MSVEEITKLVQDILERKYPADKRELCILYRHYICAETPMEILMESPAHAIRQMVSVRMCKTLSRNRPYTKKLREDIGRVSGATGRSIFRWVEEGKER